MPYYNDPNFLNQFQAPKSVYGSPFAATQNAVAARLGAQRNAALQNQLGLANANAGYQNSLFNNAQNWQQWQGNLGLAANALQAQTGLNQNAQMAAAQRNAQKKQNKRGLFGQVAGVVGGGAGALFGGPAGAAVGYNIGSGLGGSF